MIFSQREQPVTNVRRNYTAQGRRRYLFAAFQRQGEGRSLKLKAGKRYKGNLSKGYDGMMTVVSFFVEKHRGIRHIVCRKTVYIRVKLHNYTLYAGIHTYFFVRSVKNAKKMSAVLLKMTHLNGKILDFEKGRKNSRCFYAENDDVVKQLRGRSAEK